MAGLQRSAISFRRQGSSGSVWDDKFLAELNRQFPDASQKVDDAAKAPELKRSKSDGGKAVAAPAQQQAYKAVKMEDAVEDPPSPRVAACGLCGVFGRSPAKKGT